MPSAPPVNTKFSPGEHGFSMVEVLMVTGLLVGLSFFMMATLMNLQQTQKGLVQKNEVIELKQTLLATMANPATCSCQLAGLKFNSESTTSVIPLNSLKAGCGAGSITIAQPGQLVPGTQTGLRIDQVRMAGFNSSGGSAYTANFEITFASDSLVHALRPVRLTQNFQVNPLSPPTDREIASCSTILAVQCPAGRILSGISADGSPVCVDGSSIANLPTTNGPGNGQGCSSGSRVTSSYCGPDNFVIEVLRLCNSSPDNKDGPGWGQTKKEDDGTNVFERKRSPAEVCTP
ncbi:MAG: hypothetical protein NDI61_08285 [Bdellovibrionaceae bacterium]|nr:hypothetical protein [Pseudobdellovibrionaceae bacterium]